MAQLIADRREVDFVLHEQLDVDKLSKDERFAEFKKKTVDLIVSEARQMVGLQGFANASAAYMYSLNYARERIQSRELKAPAGFLSTRSWR